VTHVSPELKIRLVELRCAIEIPDVQVNVIQIHLFGRVSPFSHGAASRGSSLAVAPGARRSVSCASERSKLWNFFAGGQGDKVEFRRTPVVFLIVGLMLLGKAQAQGQARPEPKPPLAEDVFKNVQVLRGISVDEFMDTMGFFSASLTWNCTTCHGEASAGDKTRYADETPLKQTARKMILMVMALNKNSFGGARAVTCYTCHRGYEKPDVRPRLAMMYSIPPADDPNAVEIRRQDPDEPSAEQVFDQYIQALGGAERLADLTSFVAKGTYEGYDTDRLPVPVEVFAKAPNQRTTIAHTPRGDVVTTYDGRAAWTALPDNVVPIMALTGENLAGARMEAMLSFPAQWKQGGGPWLVGKTRIDDREVALVEQTGGAVKLYFDKDSGLLVRLVRYTDSIVGQIPAQVDYSDYREVAGVKMPFKWIHTWVDGQTTVELTDIQPNAPIDAAKFAKPPAKN
jgi:photosynthetic reaction center cytochrome c subunit